MTPLATSNTDRVARQNRQATGAQPDQTPVGGQPGQNQTGGGGGSGVSKIIAGAGISVSPSGGTGAVTVSATASGGIPSGGAASQELRYGGSSGTAKWAYAGYQYPEDYGAIGNGSADDSAAIMAAYSALAYGQALYLGGFYGIGTTAALNFTSGKAIVSSPTAAFQPSSVNPATNGPTIGGGSGSSPAGEISLPVLSNFPGYGFKMSNCGVTRIRCPLIAGCGVAVLADSTLGTLPDNWVEVVWITSCGTALKVTCGNNSSGYFIQGNRFYFNYCGSCLQMLNFDGSALGTATAWVSGTPYVAGDIVYDSTTPANYECLHNVTSSTPPSSDPTNWAESGVPGSQLCDSNELIIGATDSGTTPGGAIFFCNDQSNGSTAMSNWTLAVTMWNGGLNLPSAGSPSFVVAADLSGTAAKFSNCRFGVSNLNYGGGADNKSYYQVTGDGNRWDCANASSSTNGGNHPPQSSAGSLVSFLNSLGFTYTNHYFCPYLLAAPYASVPANGTITLYVYSPFWDGNSFPYKIIPTAYSFVNPGFHLESMKLTGTEYEIALVFRNVSGATINAGSGIGLDFILVHGLP